MDFVRPAATVRRKNGAREVRLLTAVQAAEYLGVSYSTIRRLAFAGEFPIINITCGPTNRCRVWRIDVNDLDKLIERGKVMR
jgi:excisionase family DNA binding protein